MSSFEEYSQNMKPDDALKDISQKRDRDLVLFRSMLRRIGTLEGHATGSGDSPENPTSGIYFKSPDETVWLLTISDAGTPTVTAV